LAVLSIKIILYVRSDLKKHPTPLIPKYSLSGDFWTYHSHAGFVMWYKNEWPAHTTLWCERSSKIQEKTRSAKYIVDRHSQEEPTKFGMHLRKGGGRSPWQTRVMSKGGLMWPPSRPRS